MKKLFLTFTMLAFLLAAASLASAKGQGYYVCSCPNDCKCSSVSLTPGKCKCGKERVALHLLSIDKDTATFCTCGADCTCKPNSTDPSKCGCGKPIRKASLKGLYACGCGPDCKCSSISDKPGKCGCKKPLKKVE